ncbi:vitamin K-dependent protein Z isoform X1 [Equus quagga]|uniref:vitamin K-dependent protein Z isoform X1 n=1 Tax=Equus quagga TaxID=89248 RepID=UPI001EE1CD2C|nr:vitamin K-dependent protein Z isoform X1 [Equus quagga]XP_046520850.1 vitamin K-dependent protein Z isoform X1 [Equus quagga]XP_046520851.1 vitamin K-dependent protein Z isoform X1 [Equus quagga]XP_046520852.1 vitamin K-dependent protein Z isoform X1 [Equus quagga]XP_046520854.1 vitamin K-dependent protein Z isoform X1 [Equus quagga]
MASCVPLLLVLVRLAIPAAEPSVFLSASKANTVLARWKRAGSYLLEELFEGNLEKECYEEICVYEEAREVFENDATTGEFWTRYMGGSPCTSQPCRNNGSCQDSIRSYTCTCAPGYEGRDCAFALFSLSAKNECHPLRTDGCQHFCHPGHESYRCSCAKGYKLGQDRKSCIPHGEFSEKCACGILKSESVARPPNSTQSLQVFPWQVKLTNSKGEDFCGGVIIQENFVLTTAKCSLLHKNITVKTNFPRTSRDPLTIAVQSVHVHMRYEEETGDNDVSLLELGLPIQCPDAGLPVCMPERDFAERALIPRTEGLLSGWTLNGSRLGNVPTQLLVTHMDSEECGQALDVTVTTRTYCERGTVAGGLRWAEGSMAAREHEGTWFLTGILRSAPTDEHGRAFLLTKVSRYSLWFRQIMKQLSPANQKD